MLANNKKSQNGQRNKQWTGECWRFPSLHIPAEFVGLSKNTSPFVAEDCHAQKG